MSLFKTLEAPHSLMMIVDSQRIGSHIQKVTLGLEKPVSKPFTVGAYIQPLIGGWVPRAYSIAEATETTCTIIVSFSSMGVGARFFASAKIGTVIKVYGPFDDFPYHYKTGKPKVFIATGTGVAPFVRMVPEATAEGVPSYLLMGAPTLQDIPYYNYFEELTSKNKLFSFVPSLSRPNETWKGYKGYITQLLPQMQQILLQSDVYLCGVPPMISSTKSVLRKMKIPSNQIHVQKFG